MNEAPWWRLLRGDPTRFLLDEDEPGVLWRTLVELLGRPHDAPAVIRAKRASRDAGVASRLLARQDPMGYWGSPATYGARWGGTAWHVIALAQLGADPEDPRVILGAETLLESLQPRAGGFAVARGKPPSSCFTAEVCAAFARFGFGHHPRVREAVAWLGARDGEGGGWPCPELRHLAGGGCPVAAVALLRREADMPAGERHGREALGGRAAGWLLASRLFLDASAPPGWFHPGHPCLARTDLVDALAALARCGARADGAIGEAMAPLLAQQAENGCWKQRVHAPFGERSGEPSRWITAKALVAIAAFHTAVPAEGAQA